MNAQKSMDLRFLKKILTDKEIHEVQSCGNPDALLWTFWACKEAAYKVLRKINGNAAFMPRCWAVSCHLDPQRSHNGLHQKFIDNPRMPACCSGDVLVAEACKIPFRVYLTSSYVCSVAADSMAALDHAVWKIEEVPQTEDGQETDPSAFVRACLVRHLGEALQKPVSSINICREKEERELLPPAVYLNQERLNVDISLSHDGKYAGYVFIVHPCQKSSLNERL